MMQRALIKIRDSFHNALDELNDYVTKTIENGKRLNTIVVESFGAMEHITDNIDLMNTIEKDASSADALA